MRMWGVDPEILCRSHLLGEHKELHMLVGSLRLGRSIRGFVSAGLVDTRLIASRHKSLVVEMERRGYRHASPLGDYPIVAEGFIDVDANLAELRRRCGLCRA